MLGIGLEAFGESADEASLDLGDVAAVGAEQPRILPDGAEPAEPGVPSFAEIVELLGDGGRVAHEHRPQRLEG